MKMIAIPDLHGQYDYLPDIAEAISAVDLVILPGDITVGGRHIETIIDHIHQQNEHILAVVGNMDNHQVEAQLNSRGINLHAQHRIIDGIAFVGLGGALPFFGEFAYSEDDFARFIHIATKDIPPNTPQILISHNPPFDTINDLAHGKHVGSKAIRHYIETQQPLLCLTGHIHEGRGIDKIGETQIVNPGPLWRDGGYVFIEINEGTIDIVEIRKPQGER